MIESWLVSVVSTAVMATPFLVLLSRLRLGAAAKVCAIRAAVICCAFALLPILKPVSLALPAEVKAGRPDWWLAFMAWMAFLWTLGFLQVWATTLIEHFRWKRGLGRLTAAGPTELLYPRSVSAAMRCKTPIVRRSDSVIGALVAPGIRPYLILGPGPIDEGILRHELAHIRGRDALWLTIARALVSVLWFHPGMWALEAELRLAQEILADRRAAGDQPLAFAKLLVEAYPSAQPSLVQALLSDSGQLAARIQALRAPERTRSQSLVWVLALLLFVASASLELPSGVIRMSSRAVGEDAVAVRAPTTPLGPPRS